MKRSYIKRKTPLRRVSKKRAALMRKVGPERRELKERVGECMYCRKALDPERLDAHEVANGAAREKCMEEPLLVIVLCRPCHDDVQGWQPARQIGLHFKWLIERGCKRFCELNGLADTAVVPDDVITFLMYQKPAKRRVKAMTPRVKKRSATTRLQEIFHHYQNNVVGGRPVTMEEVSQWAIDNQLYPVPSIRDAADLAAVWDRRFLELTKAPTDAPKPAA